MNNKEQTPNYPKHSTWAEFGKQMFHIWMMIGEDDNDPCPKVPTLEELHQPTPENILVLNKKWADTETWLKRNDCRIQDNGTVVRLPAPKNKPLKVEAHDPYANDVLGRNKKLGDVLTEVINMQSEPFVLALDGAWGSGKSVFIDMWTPALSDHYDVISFNAWTNDFTTDPLVALASEVDEKFGGKFDPEKLTGLFRVGSNLLLKAVSMGLCSRNELDAEKLKPTEEQKINSWFSLYRSQKELCIAFQRQLTEIAGTAKGHKLVFLIDELDRCRPTYAIEFLERVKHLFMVPGVCFVLAMDRAQLRNTIQSVYGNIDTESYLRRFIDLIYKLPTPDHEKFTEHLFQKQHLTHYLNQRSINDGAADWMNDILAYFSTACEFSLRDIEHIVRHLVLCARSTRENILLSPLLLTLLACLKLYNEDLYFQFCAGKRSTAEILKELPNLPERELRGASAKLIIEATLKFADIKEPFDPRSEPNNEDEEKIHEYIRTITQWHNGFSMRTPDTLSYVHDKLELFHEI